MNKSVITTIFSIVLIGIGYWSPVYSEQILSMGLYSFSGAITNWLAIHMLFEKVPGLYGSGIVTERFEDFKIGIKNLIMTQFFTKENFERFMSNNSSSLLHIEEELLMESVDFDKIFEKLKSAILDSQFGPMLGMFGGAQALEPLRPKVQEKIKEIILDLTSDKNFIQKLTQKSEEESGLFSSVNNIVEQRLNELTPTTVKEIIQSMIKEHLGWLVVWGGVFGALLGLLSTFL